MHRAIQQSSFLSCQRQLIVGCVLLGVVVVMGARDSTAIETKQIKDHERAVLPKYCRRTQSLDPNPFAPGHLKDYVKRYGDGWNHMHHYCWALVALMRYSNPSNTAANRRFWSNSAIRDMDYVLNRSDHKFVMWFTIMHKKAKTMLRENGIKEATEVALELKKHFTDRADVFGLLAEIEISKGNKAEARKILESAAGTVKDVGRLKAIRIAYELD